MKRCPDMVAVTFSPRADVAVAADRPGDIADQARLSSVDAMGAALAHELNQPLAALSIYLESLQALTVSLTGDTALLARELVEKARRETMRTSDIVRRMRRFTARSEPERQAIDINAIAEESIDVAFLGTGLAAALRLDLARDLPPVSADPNQIRQVMVNLLRNAIDALVNHKAPAVTVTTLQTAGAVHFTVKDNGPGVAADMQGKLFRAFETNRPNGLGLGLAISRMIAQNHGGDLAHVAEPGNTGACFVLRLPVR